MPMQHKDITILSIDELQYIHNCMDKMPQTDGSGTLEIMDMINTGYVAVTFAEKCFVVYKISGSSCHVYSLYAPSKMDEHRDIWLDYLKSQGVTKLTALSALPEDKFIKSTGMKKKYIAYERLL